MAESALLILPELILFLGAMSLLLYGVYGRSDTTRAVFFGAEVLLIIAALLTYLIGRDGGGGVAFGGSFVLDDFALTMKVLIYLTTALAITMARDYMARENLQRYEYAVLVLLAACGMGVMISANNMITVYMGLELQSLALYVVATFKRDSLRSTEAGLKYFVLGALSSGLLLYGMSLVYGATGSTDFATIASAFAASEGLPPTLLTIGITFIIAGLAFKISAVPFHMWTPDVYEGAPTPITAFFATAPKLAAMALFIRVISGAFMNAEAAWQQIIIFLSFAGMVLGAFAAIGQQNIKRLMAYSSIAHIGFALVGFAAATSQGITATIFYMIVYVIMNLGTFACILAMRRDEITLEQISDLAGLSKTHPLMALALAILMFSLAGIPPMIGFFGKLYVFQAAIVAGLYPLAIIGVLASVVGAYYYLRIIKIMYLDDVADEPMESMPRPLAVIAAASSVIALFFLIYPAPLLSLAEFASAATGIR